MTPNPHQPTGMNELREIFKQSFGVDYTKETANNAPEAAIQQLVERCIGSDEEEYDSSGCGDPECCDNSYIEHSVERNELRAELRHNLQQAGLLKADEEKAE